MRYRRRTDRRAFTLIEMLITLSVIVLLAGMVVPSLRKQYAETTLRRSMEQVRIAVGRGRNAAIQAGIEYQFRYEPGGTNFVCVPAERDPGSSEEGSMRIAGKLPEGLLFEELDAGSQNIVPIDPDFLEGLTEAGELRSVTWGAPIWLRPDGTTTTANWRIIDEGNFSVEMYLAGLTGVVTVGDILEVK